MFAQTYRSIFKYVMLADSTKKTSTSITGAHSKNYYDKIKRAKEAI